VVHIIYLRIVQILISCLLLFWYPTTPQIMSFRGTCLVKCTPYRGAFIAHPTAKRIIAMTKTTPFQKPETPMHLSARQWARQDVMCIVTNQNRKTPVPTSLKYPFQAKSKCLKMFLVRAIFSRTPKRCAFIPIQPRLESIIQGQTIKFHIFDHLSS
jgi:hypothetical protein